MKKILLLVFAFAFSFGAFSQEKTSVSGDSSMKNKYCAKVVDGRMIMMEDDKALTADITLENGMKITTNANVISADGTKTPLRAGECVDRDGHISEPSKNKMSDDSKMEHK